MENGIWKILDAVLSATLCPSYYNFVQHKIEDVNSSLPKVFFLKIHTTFILIHNCFPATYSSAKSPQEQQSRSMLGVVGQGIPKFSGFGNANRGRGAVEELKGHRIWLLGPAWLCHHA